MSGTEARVFVSHTTQDKRDLALAHELADGLRERGAKVWIAPEDIPVGAEWEPEIVSAIMQRCTHFLIIVSAASTTAEWVLKEIELAEARHNKDACFTILPLVAGKVGEYPGREFISRFQHVPYRDGLSDQLDCVISALALRPGVPDQYAELTEGFVGRDYVFAAFEDFRASEASGYFSVVGDPGEGKSAILAEYVRQTGCVAHFNVRAQSINRTGQCLESLYRQVCTRYGVSCSPPPEDPQEHGSYWDELLKETVKAVGEDDGLVVVVDALDEVELAGQPPGANILALPRYLPEGVHFLLSRRRKDVPFVVQSSQTIFDLINYRDDSLHDIHTYISRATGRQQLREWIEARALGIEAFVSTLAEKSEFNFMYLRYVLPEIERGAYRDLSIERLPVGLEGYYEDHWERMGMRATPLPRSKIRIVYILAEVRQPVSRQLIVDFSKEDAVTVQGVVDEWRQFLHEQEVDGQMRYSVYHTSFLDFLHRKDIVQAAGETIEGVHAAIADDLWEGLIGNG